jgi:hypothetical protein
MGWKKTGMIDQIELNCHYSYILVNTTLSTLPKVPTELKGEELYYS